MTVTPWPLKRVVRSVAKWPIAGAFAAAEIHGLRSVRLERHRRDAGVLVRTVAERLRLTTAARAPEVLLAGLDVDLIRSLLRDLRFCHVSRPHSVATRFCASHLVSDLIRLPTHSKERCSHHGKNLGMSVDTRPGKRAGRFSRKDSTPSRASAERPV